MNVSTETSAKAAPLPEDPDPHKHQHLRERGRSNSPVLVYDRDQKTVQVRNKKNIGQYFWSIPQIGSRIDLISL